MFFGTKKPERETVLLLDVESGSVGAALALLARGEQPKMFGEVRITLPIVYHHGSAALVPQIERAAREALVHSARVAANLRTNDKVSGLGEVSRAAVFLSAPWGAPNLADGKQTFHASLQKSLSEEIKGYLGVGAEYYTGADSAAYCLQRLLPREPLLVCVVKGETAELLLMGEQGVLGYATLPSGLNTVLRTLKSHGGMTDAETLSILALAAHPHTPAYEPLEASAQHFVEEFAGAAQHLLARECGQENASGIFVIAPESTGDWFARALGADESLGAYFPQGGTVRALRAHHLAPHVSGHLNLPDLHLLLDALFVGGKHSAVY